MEHLETYLKELECVKKSVGKGRKVEIGGGTGAFSKPLDAIALDLALPLLQIAKKKGIECVLGDAQLLPFRSKSFNESFFVASLCFIDDPKRAIEEALRVSKEYVVACILPRESTLVKDYMKKGSKGHPIYRYAKFLSSKDFENWERVCLLEWFQCYKLKVE